MRALAAVGVHDDLPAGEAGVSRRTSDHEFSGRIDVQDEVVLEKSGCLRVEGRLQFGQENIPDIGLDLVVHRLVHLVLAELTDSLRIGDIPEPCSHEVIVLGGDDDGMYTHRMVSSVIFNGELGLGVRPQVRHQLRGVVADVRKDLEGDL